jgi:hypothetical protein
MTKETKTVYVTKWWRSKGILRCTTDVYDDSGVTLRVQGMRVWVFAKYCYDTPREAIAAVKGEVVHEIELKYRKVARLTQKWLDRSEALLLREIREGADI